MFLFLIVICSLLISGCLKEDFSRFPSIQIPRYTEGDYFNLLSNKNPEIVYNAVVILGRQAEKIGERLTDEKADKNSAEYISALNIYKKIVVLLNSRDVYVVSASLRFLQLFSNKYKAKAELLEPVLKIRNNSPQILYEQVMTLGLLVNKDSNIPDSVVRKFLNSPSWIVSRSAYFLVDSLKHDQLRQELINKYRIMKDEKEKLLILSAMEKQFSGYVTDFLLDEVLTTSDKIRYEIFDRIENCKDQEKVLEWLDQNYDKVVTVDGRYLFKQHFAKMDKRFSSRLLSIFLKRNFAADKEFLDQLNKELEVYKNKKELSDADRDKLNNFLEVEKALLTNKLLAEQWKALREKKEVRNLKLTQLQNEYDVFIKEFSTKIDQLFKSYNISDKNRQEYIKGMVDSRDYLREMLENDNGDE